VDRDAGRTGSTHQDRTKCRVVGFGERLVMYVPFGPGGSFGCTDVVEGVDPAAGAVDELVDDDEVAGVHVASE
jgi:hypothetical protein